MNLTDRFDAVIMLTWSDWETEPRSNRFHYATRFSKQLPVFFFQHGFQERDSILLQKTDYPNLNLVNVSFNMDQGQVLEIKSFLYRSGVKNPLIWIYDSINYNLLIDSIATGYRVYHATEDYFTASKGLELDREFIAENVRQLLSKVDYLVACTEGVARSCVENGGYSSDYTVVNNGVDSSFFLDFSKNRVRSNLKRKVAIFQGGINKRLDYDLLTTLVDSLPEWDFKFCGRVSETEAWKELNARGNVYYLGELEIGQVARHMCDADVGLIPFIQDDWIFKSLPLKAFEYVACGLPVVTIPIDSLKDYPDFFHQATDAQNFRDLLISIHESDEKNTLYEQRLALAKANCYDKRFELMSKSLLVALDRACSIKKKLRIAVLYDSASTHVGTIKEHLESFDLYSKNRVDYIPATPAFWGLPGTDKCKHVSFDTYDALILHYSVRLSIKDHLSPNIVQALLRFCGVKVLFIQDEYEGVEIAREWLDLLQFNIIYTCVPLDEVDKVYPKYRYPGTKFLTTLTGYVPLNQRLESYALPYNERTNLIGYRGRKLPEIYGRLGYQKYQIGIQAKKACAEMGLSADIEVDDSSRIYGTGWYQFLGSSVATLGTESGSNIFDFTGEISTLINKYKSQNPNSGFEKLYSEILAQHDGYVKMNQVSPKIFESIILRTILILFRGNYSGVIEADKHYLALNEDFSNFADIVEKIKDPAFVKEMTDAAYNHVVASKRFSYECFIEKFDDDLAAAVVHSNNKQPVSAGVFVFDESHSCRQVLPMLPSGVIGADNSTLKPTSIEELARLGRSNISVLRKRNVVKKNSSNEFGYESYSPGNIDVHDVRHCPQYDFSHSPQTFSLSSDRVGSLSPSIITLWNKLPPRVQMLMRRNKRLVVFVLNMIGSFKSYGYFICKRCWYFLPLKVRYSLGSKIASFINRCR